MLTRDLRRGALLPRLWRARRPGAVRGAAGPGRTTTAGWVSLVMGAAVATLDFSSWYADRALLSIGLLVALLIYGTATALTGKSIFGDPLKDSPGR